MTEQLEDIGPGHYPEESPLQRGKTGLETGIPLSSIHE
jgi:hypothetical protein